MWTTRSLRVHGQLQAGRNGQGRQPQGACPEQSRHPAQATRFPDPAAQELQCENSRSKIARTMGLWAASLMISRVCMGVSLVRRWPGTVWHISGGMKTGLEEEGPTLMHGRLGKRRGRPAECKHGYAQAEASFLVAELFQGAALMHQSRQTLKQQQGCELRCSTHASDNTEAEQYEADI